MGWLCCKVALISLMDPAMHVGGNTINIIITVNSEQLVGGAVAMYCSTVITH